MTEKERARRKEKYEDYKLAYAALMLCYPFGLEDLDGEIWDEVGYYPERYHISNYGRLKSFYNGIAKIRIPCLYTGGYLYFNLSKDDVFKNFKVHRLVAEAFIPNPNNLPEVDHRYGNKFDNYFENLEWVSHAENKQRALHNGIYKTGGDFILSGVTNEQAVEIREAYIPYDLEFGASALARKLGVKVNVIWGIVNGKTYKNAGKKSGGDDTEQ